MTTHSQLHSPSTKNASVVGHDGEPHAAAATEKRGQEPTDGPATGELAGPGAAESGENFNIPVEVVDAIEAETEPPFGIRPSISPRDADHYALAFRPSWAPLAPEAPAPSTQPAAAAPVAQDRPAPVVSERTGEIDTFVSPATLRAERELLLSLSTRRRLGRAGVVAALSVSSFIALTCWAIVNTAPSAPRTSAAVTKKAAPTAEAAPETDPPPSAAAAAPAPAVSGRIGPSLAEPGALQTEQAQAEPAIADEPAAQAPEAPQTAEAEVAATAAPETPTAELAAQPSGSQTFPASDAPAVQAQAQAPTSASAQPDTLNVAPVTVASPAIAPTSQPAPTTAPVAPEPTQAPPPAAALEIAKASAPEAPATPAIAKPTAPAAAPQPIAKAAPAPATTPAPQPAAKAAPAPAASPASAEPPKAAPPQLTAATNELKTPAGLNARSPLLVVQALPEGARLWLDGQRMANPFDVRLPRGGKHKIEARSEGYEPSAQTVRIESDTKLTITLKRSVPPLEPRLQVRPLASRSRGAGFVTTNPY